MDRASFVLNEIYVPGGLFALLVVLSVCFVLPLIFFWQWWLYRLRMQREKVSVEYDPPLGFSPAKIAVMFGRKNADRLVAATIVALIHRSYLHVRNVEGHRVITAGPRVPDTELVSYERDIVLFVGDDEVPASDLYQRFGRRAEQQNRIYPQVVSELQQKEYLLLHLVRARIRHGLRLLLVAIVAGLFSPLIAAWLINAIVDGTATFSQLGSLIVGGFRWTVLLLPVLVILVILIDIRRGMVLGQRWKMTKKARRFLPQFIGFHEYVRLVRLEHIDFETEMLAKNSKKDTLPHAIAFGYVKSWRKLLS